MTDLLTRPAHDTPPTPMPPMMWNAPRDPRWKRRIAGGTAILVLVAGGGGGGAFLTRQYLDGRAAPAATASATITETGDLASIVARVQPSVVTVLVDSARSSSLGSGVVLGSDGLILTNNHVVSADGTVSVRLSTGRTVPASVIATDATHDLALVQATGLSGLTPVTFATDDSVAVGDTVLAFGAPLGLEGTVTSGIVSALDRGVDTGDEKLSGLFQTDAAINQGNSGGALVDTAGRVVGINVAIATAGDSTGSVGVGFAIPADTVTSVVRRLQTQTR
ncbi:trypsin-like peptidase domain-containing protein [Actinoplanes sp. NPDC049802]|uniref:S1C family serine protease n=1 Tax=Actinoplanes sp. NPDC049802 TaxID=3154742 RepID=UPI0034080D24